MRVSDYVVQFLEREKVKHIFMLSGGGIMYLVDSLGKSTIEYVCCHHEQAAGIAAQAYAMETNNLGVCLVTTGPGGTNVLTATGAAYVDSTPVLFITGQVKTSDFASLRNVRQFGAQENDIVSMAAPVTKYAVTVLEAEEIRYHLEKAIYIATHGRRGPVWLDIPLDIQSAEIDPNTLKKFDISEIQDEDIVAERMPNIKQIDEIIDNVILSLRNCKRPLFLVGHGVIASGAQDIFRDIQRKLQIPVVSTWRAVEIMDYNDAYFFGSPGLQANRYSNLITQGADFLIVLGSRMDNMITAFNENHFAFRAKKVIVDIDSNEIRKLSMSDASSVVCDVSFFLNRLKERIKEIGCIDYSEWLKFCERVKKQYPLLKEKQAREIDGLDLYQFTMKLSEYCDERDVIVASSTSRCNTAGHMAFMHKERQKTVSSMGFGSMGFALPSVVGAWFASNYSRVIMLEGDGSLQLNIQELQTIVHHHMNAKMFVFNNTGYAAIATMQDRNFEGFHVGCDAESGLTFPNLQKIAYAYEIPYYYVNKNEDIEKVIEETLGCEGPVICEFAGTILYDEIPKCISMLDANGNRVSAVLENPFPFLEQSEMNDIYKDF